jgi:hypothetical protein
MTEAKRKTLKQKVAAGQARHQDKGRTTIVDRAGEQAIETKDKFVAFAKKHPITTVAGGLALGVLVSTLFKRSPTRKAAGKAADKAAGLAAVGAEFALAYAQQAMAAAGEASRTGADKLGDLGDTLGTSARGLGRDAAASARGLGRDAAGKAGDLGETARDMARDAGKRLGEALRNRIN